MLGVGVYLTYEIDKAKNYGDTVLICIANVGKIKKINWGDPM
jgi:hypothetical protein